MLQGKQSLGNINYKRSYCRGRVVFWMFPTITKHIFIVILRLTQSFWIQQIKYKNVSQGQEYSTFRISFSPSYVKKQYLGLTAKHNLNTISSYKTDRRWLARWKSQSWGHELLHLIRDQPRGLLSYTMHQSHTRTWPQAQIFPAVYPLYGTVQRKCRPSQWAASKKAVSFPVRKLKRRWSILKDHRMLRNEKWWDLFLLSSQYVTFPKTLNFPDKLTVNKALETQYHRLKN